MKPLLTFFLIVITVISSLSQQNGSAVSVLSDWNVISEGANGWSPLNAPNLEYTETGGNNGGYIKLQGFAGSGFITSLQQFMGNYIQKGINHISVDVMFPQQIPTEYDGYKAKISIKSGYSGGKWSYQLTSLVGSDSGTWQHAELYFNPEWTDDEAKANGWHSGFQSTSPSYKTFSQVMTDVTSIAFERVFAPYQISYFAIDNFQISHKAVIPDQEEITAEQNANFSFQLSDWNDDAIGVGKWKSAYDNRTFTHQQSGGNTAGYVLVYGHPTIGIENSQTEFTGNYIQKGCNLISVDLKIPQELPVVTQHNKGTIIIKSETQNYEWRYYLSSLDVTQHGIWQHLEIPFNSNWNDDEAVANGWNSGKTDNTSNNMTFHEMMEDVTSVALRRYYENALHHLAIDNFKLSKIIEESPTAPVNPSKKYIKAPVQPSKKPVKRVIRKTPVKTNINRSGSSGIKKIEK